MNAIILAAGYGTRLLPYTSHTPKPLFPIAGASILDMTIEKLASAGCQIVVVNTHHLHRRVEEHIASRRFPIPVHVTYEPEILGTGGALLNAADLLGNDPFFVVNGDIVFDVDLAEVYRHHRRSGGPVTMVLCPHPELDSVCVSNNERVTGFADRKSGCATPSTVYTFTGIHVVDPAVLSRIPENQFHSIIDTYKELIADAQPIHAHIIAKNKWTDIGTPGRYRDLVYSRTAPAAFEKAFSFTPLLEEIDRIPLAGDGSDRRWFRLTCRKKSLILADHGIRPTPDRCEADAFAAIGIHLRGKGLPVPEIILSDPFSGLIYVSDHGDIHLQSVVSTASQGKIETLYRKVIDRWSDLAVSGRHGFQTDWTYQTPRYDRTLILQKECRYFVDEFLNGHLNLGIDYRDLEKEFEWFADTAEQHFLVGLIHRDMQSRNILLCGEIPFFIDFQGARLGPVQYDLASLLIDPYVQLDGKLQKRLYSHAVDRLSKRIRFDADGFDRGYRCCRIARNLQALGAFGFLTRVKRKTRFARYIPPALASLKFELAGFDIVPLPALKAIVKKI